MADNRHLAFVVFVLHVLAAAWDKSPSEVYAICKDSAAVDGYLIPHYDVLHSLGANAIIEDLTEYVRERGARL